MEKNRKTITDNTVDPDVLAYTVGDDPVLDLALTVWDCMGTAAHVTMLSEMKGLRRPVVTKAEAAKVRRELGRIAALAEKGRFEIRVDDQDVHNPGTCYGKRAVLTEHKRIAVVERKFFGIGISGYGKGT